MALQEMWVRKGRRNPWRQRRRNQRRTRKYENAARRHLYIRPLADVLAKLFEAIGRIFGR
jgi:hypothetical protein